MAADRVRSSPSALLTGVLALLSFVVPMATDMYLPAFPRMAEELHTDASGVQLTLTAFLVGLAAGQLVLGPLSDRLGRRGPMLAGTSVCTVVTVLCALAPSLPWLVAMRFMMGFSGAAGIMLGRAVISDQSESHAAILHFSGRHKPWQAACPDGPSLRLYRRYLQRVVAHE